MCMCSEDEGRLLKNNMYGGCKQGDRGPMLWLKKIFFEKFSKKKLAFFAQTNASLFKKIDHNIGLWD
jgi:hypothetical protein